MEGPSTGNHAASTPGAADASRLGNLAHFSARYRWPVIAVWIVLTLVGGVVAGKLSTRWYQSTAIPGKPAYETGLRVLKAFGAGVRTPNVVVYTAPHGDVTKSGAVRAAVGRVAKAYPGALTSSYFSTGSSLYVSRDRHTTFQEVYPAGRAGVDKKSGAIGMRAIAAKGLPAGVTVNVTGRDALDEANAHAKNGGTSVLLERVIGGMLIPVVSVLATLTLLPALLAVLGTRINTVRVMPRRFADQGHPEDGAWGRWARFVLRRPAAVATVGLIIVAALVGLGTQLNPSEAQLKYFPGTGTAIAGRTQLAAAGISPGVMKPLDVLVSNGADPQLIAATLRAVPGVVGATAPPDWKRGPSSFVEGFAGIDGAAPGIQRIIDRANASLKGTNGSLTGIAATDRDFVHALFGSFPYAIALV